MEDQPVLDHAGSDAERSQGPTVPARPGLVREVECAYVSVEVALPDTTPIVVLEEVDPPHRRLMIPVGTAEGVAIAYAAKAIATPKPLTHKLFIEALESFLVNLDLVRITRAVGNAFYGEIVLSGPSGRRVLACRPSDGICLALTHALPVPIMVAEVVLGATTGDSLPR